MTTRPDMEGLTWFSSKAKWRLRIHTYGKLHSFGYYTEDELPFARVIRDWIIVQRDFTRGADLNDVKARHGFDASSWTSDLNQRFERVMQRWGEIDEEGLDEKYGTKPNHLVKNPRPLPNRAQHWVETQALDARLKTVERLLEQLLDSQPAPAPVVTPQQPATPTPADEPESDPYLRPIPKERRRLNLSNIQKDQS